MVTSDINALILDYLTVAGYPNAAARFCTEANLTPQQPNSDIITRQRIRRSIHEGEIEEAIKFLNELDPSVSYAPKFSPHFITSLGLETEFYMHHSYGLRAVDEKQPPLYELNPTLPCLENVSILWQW